MTTVLLSRTWGSRTRTRTRTCKLVLEDPQGQGLSSRTTTLYDRHYCLFKTIYFCTTLLLHNGRVRFCAQSSLSCNVIVVHNMLFIFYFCVCMYICVCFFLFSFSWLLWFLVDWFNKRWINEMNIIMKVGIQRIPSCEFGMWEAPFAELESGGERFDTAITHIPPPQPATLDLSWSYMTVFPWVLD